MANLKLRFQFLMGYIVYAIWRFLHFLGFPICEGYEGPCLKLGKRRRRNTAYEKDEMNFTFQCQRCFDSEAEYWKERWDEYYGSRF